VIEPADLAVLRDCRKLFLHGLEVQARIGVHDFERGAPQRLSVDVDLYVPLAISTPARDRIEEVVDYDFIRVTVLERIGQGHIELQETLCDDILDRLLARPEVTAARVCTAKLDVYPGCAAVGCERFAFRERS